MRSSTDFLMKVFEAAHERRNRIIAGLLVLSLLVFAGVFWQLRYTGITMTSAPMCGEEEHTHSAECGEYVLIDSAVGLEAAAAQTEVYVISGEGYIVLADVAAEIAAPQYTEYYSLSFENCASEEHIHSVRCYCDTTADIEDAEYWESTLPDSLYGNPVDNLISIAVSQIGYDESELNFVVNDDGTRNGYTRYGQWYNNPYGNWDTMFASFCVNYALEGAGISADEVPYASGANSWKVALVEAGLYSEVGDAEITAGSVVFFNTDDDEDAERTGIVVSVNGDGTIDVVEGNVSVGADAPDTVVRSTYRADDQTLAGMLVLPEENTAEADDAVVMFMSTPMLYSTSAASEGDATVSLTPFITGVTMEKDADGNYTTTYDPSKDAYKINNLKFDFTVTKGDILDDDNNIVTFQYDLPEDMFVLDSLVYQYENNYPVTDAEGNLITNVRAGKDTTGAYAFDWWFVKNTDENGNNTYSIMIEFVDEYVNKLPQSTTEVICWAQFNSFIDESAQIEEEGNPNKGDIKLDLDLPQNVPDIVIDKDDAVYDENPEDNTASTKHYDVTVNKSGVFNSDTSTLDYVITVSSEKGTPAQNSIVLTDTLESNGVVIKGEINPHDVTVEKRYYLTSEYYNKDSYPLTDITSQCQISNGTTEGSGDDTTTVFTAVLPQIIDDTDTENLYTTEYVVKYSVSIEDVDPSTTINPSNNVVLENKDDEYGEDIKVDTNTNVLVNKNLLEKSSNSPDDNTITWTITVNKSQVENYGSLLMDEAFAEIVSYTVNEVTNEETGEVTQEITFTGTENVNITPATGYIWVLDENNMPAIKFIESVTAGEGEEPNLSNKQTYQIVYNTEKGSLWEAGSIINTAVLDPSPDNGQTSDRVSVNAQHYVSSNNLSKEFVSASPSGETGYQNLLWQTVVNVPTGGIPAGTVITDTISASVDGNGYEVAKKHYMTYAQVLELMADNSSVTISGAETPFTDVDFVFYGYGPTDNYYQEYMYKYDSSTGTWYSKTQYGGNDYTAMSAAPEDIHFTKYDMIIGSEISGETYSHGSFTVNYSTTANTGIVVDKGTYTNNVASGGNNYGGDSYPYQIAVIKGDSNGNTADKVFNSEDGVVQWRVQINRPLDYVAGTPITITDTLPSGVTLTALKVHYFEAITWDKSAVENGAEFTFGGWNISNTTGSYTKNDSKNEVVLTISNYADATADPAFYVYYTAVIDDVADGTAVPETVYTLENKVRVDIGDNYYGDDSHKQIVTVKEKTTAPTTESTSSTTSGGSDTPSINFPHPKIGIFDEKTHYLNYRVDINPAEADLNPDGDTLTVSDVLNYYYTVDNYDGGYSQDLKLMRDYVKLYYVEYDENGVPVYDKVVIDNYGNYVDNHLVKSGNTVAAGDWSWKYSTIPTSGGESCILDITVPDNKALVLEYTYYVDMTLHSSYNNFKYNAWNTLTIEDKTYDAVSKNGNAKYDEAYAGAESTLTYEFYKVDADNYQEVLSGAEFTLFAYDSAAKEWKETTRYYTSSSSSTAAVAGWFEVKFDTQQFYYTSDIGEDGNPIAGAQPLTYTYNTAYYIVETKAPDGYMLPDEPIEYTFYFDHDDEAKYVPSMPLNFTGSALNLSDDKQTVYAENAKNKTEVKVEKVWLDSSGNDVTEDKTTGSVDVTLYQVASTEKPGGSGSGGGGTATGSGGSYTGPDAVKIDIETRNYDTSSVVSSAVHTYPSGTKIKMYMVTATGEDAYWLLPKTSNTAAPEFGYELEKTQYGNSFVRCFAFDEFVLNEDALVKLTTEDNRFVTTTAGLTVLSAVECSLDDVKATAAANPYAYMVYIFIEADEPVTSSGGDTEPDVPVVSTETVTNVPEGYTVTAIGDYTIKASDDWKLNVDTMKIPTTDESGNILTDAKGDIIYKTVDLPVSGTNSEGETVYYSYYFKEKSVPGHEASYSNISVNKETGVTSITAVTNGTVTITNTSTGTYELPETGSVGTVLLTLNALLFMVVPVMMLFRRRETVGGEE